MEPNDSVCISADEDYIDMEVRSSSSSSSSSSFLCYSINSPPKTREEFEFKMCSTSTDKESTPSPADELFYKGKLLPLHLPPRLQMVQKLLHNSNTSFIHKNRTEAIEEEEEFTILPSITSSTTTPSSTNNNTPLDSCNISPSESCRVSSELNPDEYFFDWSTEISSFIGDNPKNSWSKKLKLIKQSSLGQKLKASRAYLKSLFTKSGGCSDESCAKAACNMNTGSVSMGKECFSNYTKAAKKNNPFGYIDNNRYHLSAKSFDKEMVEDGGLNNSHRRSFSGAIRRHSARKCSSSSSSGSSSSSSSSSSSFSFNLNGLYDLQLLKRSCSANSDPDSSIEGAIAHCKQSQQLLINSKKTVNEVVGFCSVSASRIPTCGGDKERPGSCSI